MKLLMAKLHKKFLEEEEAERKKMKGAYQSPQWGSQIRSYVIHPYKLVKDHRTGQESSEPEKVLNGEIEEFIRAYLENREKA